MSAYIISVNDLQWVDFISFGVLELERDIVQTFELNDQIFVVNRSKSLLWGPFSVKHEKPGKYYRKCNQNQIICRTGEITPRIMQYLPLSKFEPIEDFMFDLIIDELHPSKPHITENEKWISGNAELDGLLTGAYLTERTNTLTIDFSSRSQTLREYYLRLLCSSGYDAYLDTYQKIQIRSEFLIKNYQNISIGDNIFNRDFLNGFLSLQMAPIRNDMSLDTPERYSHALTVCDLCADYDIIDDFKNLPVIITRCTRSLRISPLFYDEHPFCLALPGNETIETNTTVEQDFVKDDAINHFCFIASCEILKRVFTLCGYRLSGEKYVNDDILSLSVSDDSKTRHVYMASNCDVSLYNSLYEIITSEGAEDAYAILLNNSEDQCLKIISGKAAYNYLSADSQSIPEYLKFNLEGNGYIPLIDALVGEMNCKVLQIWKARYG